MKNCDEEGRKGQHHRHHLQPQLSFLKFFEIVGWHPSTGKETGYRPQAEIIQILKNRCVNNFYGRGKTISLVSVNALAFPEVSLTFNSSSESSFLLL